ncbi:MAG: GNAT family N-acetyltransferase [Leptolyngbya sp. SIO3F4]|nr:GNAT family N-acetyltransferase [Leptolyngbya sp. SIO3F4]
MGQLRIREDDLTSEEIIAFLQAHLDEMHEVTPPESIHALDLEALRVPTITFWSVWEGNELVGCGALRELDISSGEIKSMRTARVHRGKGIGATMLKHIIEEATQRSYQRLYLETGAMAAFEPARALYKSHGFEYRGPFADYVDDPNSVFMTKNLENP